MPNLTAEALSAKRLKTIFNADCTEQIVVDYIKKARYKYFLHKWRRLSTDSNTTDSSSNSGTNSSSSNVNTGDSMSMALPLIAMLLAFAACILMVFRKRRHA